VTFAKAGCPFDSFDQIDACALNRFFKLDALGEEGSNGAG
jgi:hypothetical protein